MGQPLRRRRSVGESLIRPEPIVSIPAEAAGEHPAGALIIRAAKAGDARLLNRIRPERIVWIEAPLALSAEAWPPGAGLDVSLADPASEAPQLYTLLQMRDVRPLRVTIPVLPGVARAARIAMALQLPLRLLALQPSAEAMTELQAVLHSYLHDSQTTASVQPFEAALAYWLHGDAPSAWAALDLDPALIRRLPGEAGADFVEAHLRSMMENRAECANCPFLGWCAGFFKWPDAQYACEPAVKPLLAAIRESADRIGRDLREADEGQSP